MGEPEHVVATAWVLQHPAVNSAIVGVRTVEQLDCLDRAAELAIDDSAMARLNKIFDINKGRRIGAGRSPEAHAW
jgi:aryl-alcohol dehydrogenase-like predicted oxidoreductase